MIKKILFIFLIIVISGLSGIVADRYLFPRLVATRFFSKYEFLKKSAENVTVINKTEQVYVREESSVNRIASQVVPAVVNILSYSASGASFKNGTGEIVTSDGIIMTYAEAINLPSSSSKSSVSPKKYKVLTADGNVYDGEFLGVDSWSNLAFLKINASNLPVVSFGNPGDYAAGEKVVAIGNDTPEYQNKFASGVLSGFDHFYNISGQTLSSSEKLEGIYLLDFNAEKFLSGGPIVDYSGQVAGVIGQTFRDGKIERFAIASGDIKKVLEKVINKRLDANPALGVYSVSLSKSHALSNGSNLEKGALIFSPSGQQGLAIIAGSPAARAGLKINDVIIKVGENEIDPANNLSAVLYKYKKGDAVELTIIRAGEEIKATVQL